MRSQAWFASRDLRWRIVGLAVLVLLTVRSARAQVACTLLQQAELESVLAEWASGGKATEFSGASDDSTGIGFDTCRSEIVREQGNLQIVVVVVTNLPMDGGDAIRVRDAQSAREPQWKVQDAQFAQKSVGQAMCTLSGRPNVPASSVCAIPRDKGYLEVKLIAPSLRELPSMDAVATLVQKAFSRLR